MARTVDLGKLRQKSIQDLDHILVRIGHGEEADLHYTDVWRMCEMNAAEAHGGGEDMAHYLVSAVPKADLIEELGARLSRDEFRAMKPFGTALTYSLRNARLRWDGVAVWEEEDYCRPPLAEERLAVLDAYFHELRVEPVNEGAGWSKIGDLPCLFPDLAEV